MNRNSVASFVIITIEKKIRKLPLLVFNFFSKTASILIANNFGRNILTFNYLKKKNH